MLWQVEITHVQGTETLCRMDSKTSIRLQQKRNAWGHGTQGTQWNSNRFMPNRTISIPNCINPLRPNSDGSQTSHCNIKDLSGSQVMRIENMITLVQFY